MPSLRKRVTTYLRQLSFTSESRDRIGIDRTSLNKAGCSITRYLEGDTDVIPKGPAIHHGKTPQSLPDLPIALYSVGPESITAACTGPGEGLTSVQRSCLHLSAGPDIDFIDKPQEDITPTNENVTVNKNPLTNDNKTVSNDSKNIVNNSKNIENENIEKDKENNDGNRNKEEKVLVCIDNSNEPHISDALEEKIESISTENIDSKVHLDNVTDSTIIQTSDTDSQTSVDIVPTKNPESNVELSKVEKEKLRLRNLPKYECRRTKTLSETVLKRPRRELKSVDKTQSIVLVTTTLQMNTAVESNDNKNIPSVAECKSDVDKPIEAENHSEEEKLQCVDSNTQKKIHELDTSTEQDICNSNVENNEIQNIKIETLRTAEGASETIAGVNSWNSETEHAYGISTSLYEHNPLLGDRAGQPIADCFGLVARGDAAALALADGVNWGNGAKLAACSAVHGCLSYLNKAIFGLRQGDAELTTREVFVSLLRSFWEAHACIIESGGALCTLTAAVILPLGGKDTGRSVVCCCNVGDSLAYVYSHVYGVREITQGSHDINSMRDMRDALGALGPVNGTNPELNNLTLSLTIVEPGDLVFLTSDGVSDNFDPVVGRFAEPVPHIKESQHLKAQPISNTKKNIENKTGTKSSIQVSQSGATKSGKRVHSKVDSNLSKNPRSNRSTPETSTKSDIQTESILKPNLQPNKTGSRPIQKLQDKKSVVIDSRPKYTRSHTSIEPRNKSYVNPKNATNRPSYNRSISGPNDTTVPRKILIPLPRSKNGLPIVNGLQRHDLTLLRIADLLNFGINGMLKPCTTSKALCKLLIDFVRMITTGKRKMLEEKELYYCERNGLLVELSRSQQKAKRKEWIEKDMFKALPGKLDHASVVAFNVGSNRRQPYCETNF